MKRFSLSALLLATVVVLAVSCSDKSTGVLIPKDAAMAVYVNTGSLSSKLSWEDIKATRWFEKLYNQAPDTMFRELLNDPSKTGLDTKKELILFVKKQGKGGYTVFEGGLKDTAAFVTLLKKIHPGVTITTEDKLNMVKDNSVILSWTADHFVVVADAPFLDELGGGFGMRGGNHDNEGRHNMDSLVAYTKSVYAIKGDASLGSDKRFASLIKGSGDVHLWVNSGELYGGMVSGMLSMMKVGDLIKGTVSTSTISFTNGKIEMDGKAYYGDELTDLIKKYKPKNVDASLINRIPSDNVYGAIAANYPPEGLQALLKVVGVDGMVNAFLGENLHYSIDDFVKAVKGDILLAVSDFSIKKEEVTIPGEDGSEPFTYSKTDPEVKVLFATSVKDKAAFEKLVSVASGAAGQMGGKLPEISYSLTDGWFAAGNDKGYVDNFLADKGKKQAYADKISGHPVGAYIDLQKILQAADENIDDSTGKQAMRESMKIWKEVVFTGGEMKDGGIVSHGEVTLVDANTNSLKQINQYLDNLFVLMVDKRGF